MLQPMQTISTHGPLLGGNACSMPSSLGTLVVLSETEIRDYFDARPPFWGYDQ